MKKLDEIVNQYSKSFYNESKQILFDPQMYIQRYQAAINCITHKMFKKQIKRIVEFGCSEMKFFVFMKNGLNDRNASINLVDIDENVLLNNMDIIQPLLSDHIKRREYKLEVNVWKGNLAKPNPNFINIDCVIALELIEHVYPDVLEEMPYHIFGMISPKIVILSTPNYEFNQLFNFEEGRIFRHDDHKFEWNREQFKDWCNNICQRFPNYIVQIEGVGLPPNENQLDIYGCCSQLAIFINKKFIESLKLIEEEKEEKGTTQDYTTSHDQNLISCNSYELLKSINYPVFVDTRDRNQKIIDECSYHINRFKFFDDLYYNSENSRMEIPIEDVANACWEVCSDKNEILNAINGLYEIVNDSIIFTTNYDEIDEEI
ncbi:hypothetical protein PVAND_006967 [Polypedilum vanderplanki]|uniref:Small RNA 2'-O-methyltransferase n=1 Tax=Polypedilum vanderplanki TaxID=319348 RepID=A0A9J6C597_POLVA|nr:hypothetical protein PVAND_006967 [Polypedilum vanderplanki]